MNIRVGKDITIQGADNRLLRWCNDNLVLDNPEFHKKQQMGRWTGNTPRTISLYSIVGTSLVLPFGTLKDVWKMYPDSSLYSVEITDLRQVKYHSHIKLYDYQERAVKAAIAAKNGVLVMPTGAGKTQTGLELISRIGGRALWLTHTQDLLNQSKKRAEAVLGYAGSGTITAGKVNIGNGITFATVQTMAKIDLEQYRDYWDVVVIDEAHHAFSAPTRLTQFGKVIGSLSARYKIGLTATPKRADGLERGMFALIGSTIHEVSREDVKHTTAPVKVRFIDTGWMPEYDCILMGDGTIDYHKVVDAMVHDKDRNELIGDVVSDVAKKGATLVLANRVQYLQSMQAYCDDVKSVCLSGMGNTKHAKEERKKALIALNDGEIDCIFSTYALAREGLDIPNLRYVVFATPEKDPTTVTQSAGRVARKADGKEYGTVIDFVDSFGMYLGWKKKRLSIYKKLDYEVME